MHSPQSTRLPPHTLINTWQAWVTVVFLYLICRLFLNIWFILRLVFAWHFRLACKLHTHPIHIMLIANLTHTHTHIHTWVTAVARSPNITHVGCTVHRQHVISDTLFHLSMRVHDSQYNIRLFNRLSGGFLGQMPVYSHINWMTLACGPFSRKHGNVD